MDGFEVTTGRIGTAAAGVGDASAALGREVATMHDLLAEIQAGWQSSEAAPRFAAAMQGYLEEARQLKDALLGQADALAATGRSFEATEASIAAAFSGGGQ
jgi:WXG100 family type VII secretion target